MESEAIQMKGRHQMQYQRVAGPGAGVEKYDLLTALAVSGLAAGGTVQASMFRLIALITARYNWTTDEVLIGQREMAALWSVDERTAKRETKRLIEMNLLEVKRPGVRGRVASYRLRREDLYQQTSDRWRSVGSDYDARMSTRVRTEPATEPSTVVKVDFTARAPIPATPSTPWEFALTQLAMEHPQLYSSWFSKLTASTPDQDGILHISAGTSFIAGYVTTHLLSILEATASIHFGRRLRCKLTV